MVTEFGDNPELKLYENWNRIRPGPAAAVIEREFDRRWTAVPFADERRREPGHTCHWLYKNIVMDANGRILPCCCAPAPGMNLVSAIVDQHAAGIFNSEWYRRARQHFSEPAHPPAGDDPYCRRCNWKQDHTQVGPEHIAQFLHSASRGKMDSAAIELLSNW
jgi:radical SAM protein with 4Fe4S-binding SPASM domain